MKVNHFQLQLISERYYLINQGNMLNTVGLS